MPENTQTTEAGKSLQANGAEKFPDTFFDKGWVSKSDLSEEVIKEPVGPTSPGLAVRLTQLLAAEQPKKRDPATPPSVPSLPLGVAFDFHNLCSRPRTVSLSKCQLSLVSNQAMQL